MELRIFVEPQQGATYEQQLAAAQATEQAGFNAFFRSDHLLVIGHTDGRPGPTDSWVTLGALARETERIRLGTLMTSATFRLPGPLAVAVAQVDEMSGGRVELGLGTGWYEQEHRAYGVPFPSLAERFARLEEQLSIVTGLWTTPLEQRFSYEGRFWTLRDSPALPKPVQSPRPPVIVGGAGPARTPALAARFADELNIPFQPLEVAKDRFARALSACEQIGRDPASIRLSAALCICCGRDQAEVARRSAAIGRPADHIAIAGTPDQVVEHLQAWAEAGATRAYLQLLDIDDLDHIRLLGSEFRTRV